MYVNMLHCSLVFFFNFIGCQLMTDGTVDPYSRWLYIKVVIYFKLIFRVL